MVIFPGIVSKMGGLTSASYVKALPIVDLQSQSSQLTAQPETFKISFTVPLQQADSETKIKSPKMQINRTKET